MKCKEFYLNVEVDKKIADTDLACAIEDVIDRVEDHSGWLDTYVGDNSQSLCFTIVPTIENVSRVVEAEKVVKDFLTDRGIDHAIEVNFQRDWDL